MFKTIFSDRNLIYACSFLRSMSFGIIAVLLAIFLTKVSFSKIEVGFVISAGLFGAAFGNLIATFLADKFGRRKILVSYALLNALSALVICFSTNFYLIALAAFLGMVNARGKDRRGAQSLKGSNLG